MSELTHLQPRPDPSDGVAVLTLDNPDQRNAMSDADDRFLGRRPSTSWPPTARCEPSS